MPEDGELVEPPFEVSGEVEGLLLVWFDDEGAHTAASRAEVPESHREMVRVDDLSLSPEQGAGADMVFVADLREPTEDGVFLVRRMSRASFDNRIAAAGGPGAAPEPADDPTPPAAGDPTDADVIIYGASWCGACRQAEAFFRQNNIEFIELDIERDPGARQAMQAAARAAGVRTTGIPVIDFRGEIIAGFNRAALQRAINRSRRTL